MFIPCHSVLYLKESERGSWSTPSANPCLPRDRSSHLRLYDMAFHCMVMGGDKIQKNILRLIILPSLAI